VKTAERSHMPNKMWEEIRLDKSYAKVIAKKKYLLMIIGFGTN
jgi:hypothetical protein